MNIQEARDTPAYKPSPKDKQIVLDLMERINDLKNHRSQLKANEYDKSATARTIEATWDYCDYVSLPHKYSHAEMQPWMSDTSHPMIMAKIDTALSVIISKNPEIELSARKEIFEKKTLILEGLYNLSWEKGEGRQKLIKFANDMAKYGSAVGREYHRYKKQELEEIIEYDPEGDHKTEKKEITVHDEPYFEVKEIRDCYFDNRAKAYDEDSIRDWAWCEEYDMSTAEKEFARYPNFKYVKESVKDKKAKGEKDLPRAKVKLWFYENVEDNEFLVTDGIVLVHKGTLLNHKLSCVIGIWKFRNDFCIYGLSLPEMLEGNQEMLDRMLNMTINQLILGISGPGYYGGSGSLAKDDMILEPKLKKLKDADKIKFVDIPTPSNMTMDIVNDIRDEADENSGVTKALGGEQVGKTLGEAVLNKEAGLRRLSLPLQNLEFALERHAQLRIDNIQRIYSRPERTEIVVNAAGVVMDEKLFKEYEAEREKGAEKLNFIQKFPKNEETGEVFRNQFKEERLPLEKTGEGNIEASDDDKWLEISPEEIKGEFDVRVKAMSTIPLSQTLAASQALETFNIIAQLPYTDLYRAEKNILKARDQDPDDWMKTEEEVVQTQEDAENPPQQTPGSFERDVGGKPNGGAPTQVAPGKLEQPAAGRGISSQISNALKV